MITSIWLKWLLAGLSLGTVLYCFFCIVLLFVQKRLIYLPSRRIAYTPETLGLTYETVWIPMLTQKETVERLHGWWIEGSHRNQSVLLYLHGNGGNISSNLAPAKTFQDLGFSVLMVDYRGYGLSDGQFPEEAELYRDAQTVWDYLIYKKGVKPENIFIFGHSLGGAIALDLAVRKPNAAGVIMESSFTSMQKVVELRKMYRFFPIRWILQQRFDSLSKLRLLQVPLYLIHGMEDRTIPCSMSQMLYDQADVPKQRHFIPLAGHNNLSSVGDKVYKEKILEFRELVQKSRKKLLL